MTRYYYSEKVAGHPDNYRWPVSFDVSSEGFLGVNQYKDERLTDRVLLSPEQVRALAKFYKAHPVKRRKQVPA